ncbi:MAG: pirin family protein [Clostridiaceae bacterium]|nr:pirin family protein [Clostridiaceae bacterium]
MMKVIKGQRVSDGAGVKLNRVIGTSQLDNVDPFFLLDEFKSDNKDDYIAGFPMHPHRGIDTITYMLEGSFTHKDSRGNEGTLNAGEVQWMTAGKGILHEEMPAMDEGQLWGYQLWVNLPAKLKMIEPKYRHIKACEIPVIKQEGIEVKLIAGEFQGKAGAIEAYFPVDYMDVRLTEAKFEIKAKGANLVYVHTGSVQVISQGEKVEVVAGNLCLIEEVEEFQVYGDRAGFLFLSSNPLKEPVARYGPIVMNTMDEILQAIDDFNDGSFEK